MSNKEKTLKKICEMISSGNIPKEVYDKYLSDEPIGFMSADEIFKYMTKDLEETKAEYKSNYNDESILSGWISKFD